jgi:L-fuconolactonase
MNEHPVVDAHQHFWDPASASYPWMTDELAAIRRPFGPDDLRPLLAEAGVDHTVLVQTRSSFEESGEFLQIAGTTDFVAGVVAWVDLAAPDVTDQLAELRDQPNGDTLVGIRHQVHDEDDADWLLRDDVRRGLEAVGNAGLVYDLLVRTRELPAALATARDLPEMSFVIDHIAKPPIAAGQIDAWAEQLQPFANLEHVSCKLSGMITEADWEHWRPDDLLPFVEHVVKVFGEHRLLFGSDWPVCLLAASYSRVKEALEDVLDRLDVGSRELVMGMNAVRVYGLSVG